MGRSGIVGVALTAAVVGLWCGGAAVAADPAAAAPAATAPAAAAPAHAAPAAAAAAPAPAASGAPAVAAPAHTAPAAAQAEAAPAKPAAQAAAAAQAKPAAPAAPAAPAKPAQPAAPAKPVAAAGVPCSAVARACIDLAHNKAWLLRGGVVEYGPVPITSGRPGYRTPVGTFRVLSRERVHLSRQFDNAPMPYSVFFIPGIAFHQGSLGVPSHGCIHLSKAAAIRFYTTLKIGDVVQAVR